MAAQRSRQQRCIEHKTKLTQEQKVTDRQKMKHTTNEIDDQQQIKLQF